MAVTINSATTRGRVSVTTVDTGVPAEPWEIWTRDNLAGNIPAAGVNTNDTRAVAVRNTFVGGGGGTTTGLCSRYFMAFSTSSIVSGVSSATLYIFKQTLGLGNGDFIPVKATAPSTTVNISGFDYDEIFQYEIGYPMNANTLGNVVDYASTATYGTSDGWNAIPLNTAACSDISSLAQFKLALVNYTYDYLYQSPLTGTNIGNGINANTNPPYLLITLYNGKVLSIPIELTSHINPVTSTTVRLINVLGAYTLYRSNVGGVGGTSNPGCSFGTNPPIIPIYTVKSFNSSVTGDYVYTDIGLTTVFNGGGNYWVVDVVSGDPNYAGFQWQISNTGQIMDTTQYCGF